MTDTSHTIWFRCDCRDFSLVSLYTLAAGINGIFKIPLSNRSLHDSIAQRTCRDLHTRATPISHADVSTSCSEISDRHSSAQRVKDTIGPFGPS